jgi:hypothetical protein
MKTYYIVLTATESAIVTRIKMINLITMSKNQPFEEFSEEDKLAYFLEDSLTRATRAIEEANDATRLLKSLNPLWGKETRRNR